MMKDNNKDDSFIEIDQKDLIIIRDTKNWKPTKEFIVAYARQLGFDVENDPPELLSIAEKYLTKDIPEYFLRAFHKDTLHILYINILTCEIELSSEFEDLAKKEYKELKEKYHKNMKSKEILTNSKVEENKKKILEQKNKEEEQKKKNSKIKRKEKENIINKKNTINKIASNIIKINNDKDNNKNEIIKFEMVIEELRKRIKELEVALKEKDNIINILKKEKDLLKIENNNIIEKFNKNISILNEQISKNEKMIEQYKFKISQIPFEFSPGEKIMSIIFKSYDDNIISSFICKNTDTFDFLEKKFYEKYSEYKGLDNIFISNGRKINKNKSLDENKIKNNDIIIIFN